MKAPARPGCQNYTNGLPLRRHNILATMPATPKTTTMTSTEAPKIQTTPKTIQHGGRHQVAHEDCSNNNKDQTTMTRAPTKISTMTSQAAMMTTTASRTTSQATKNDQDGGRLQCNSNGKNYRNNEDEGTKTITTSTTTATSATTSKTVSTKK